MLLDRQTKLGCAGDFNPLQKRILQFMRSKTQQAGSSPLRCNQTSLTVNPSVNPFSGLANSMSKL